MTDICQHFKGKAQMRIDSVEPAPHPFTAHYPGRTLYRFFEPYGASSGGPLNRMFILVSKPGLTVGEELDIDLKNDLIDTHQTHQGLPVKVLDTAKYSAHTKAAVAAAS